MPALAKMPKQFNPQEEEAAPQPWLRFFREVRRLAAKMDADENNTNDTGGERLSR